MLYLTAAAALSTSLTSRADAFLVRPPPTLARPLQPNVATFALNPLDNHYPVKTTTRLYSSKKNNDGILKKAAKKFLPKKWFQSEEEQKAELTRKQVKDNVKGGIKEMLKDAPLPIRMMGSMMSPLLSRVASDLSESMAEQQKSIEQVLDDARAYILGDDMAIQALGEPVRIGSPFSQSSSTSIINGQKTTNIQLAFPVNGSRGSGVAQATATQSGLSDLVLQVDGRQIRVNLSRKGSSSRVGRNHRSSGRIGSKDDDNIIEAEIIEKETKN